MEGNLTDAISYYQKSFEVAKNQRTRNILNISLQNLVHTNLAKGNTEKAQNYLQEYKALFQDKTLTDLTEEVNLQIEIARENNDPQKVSEIIEESIQVIRPLLSKEKQLTFDVNNLRMIFNNLGNVNSAIDQVYDNIDLYFKLDMPEKYLALKEISIPLRMSWIPIDSKYKDIRTKIDKYMQSQALKDIEVYTSSLEDFEVKKRCKMELEKVAIQKEWIRPYDFEKIYNTMVDVKDIYQKNGMVIESIFSNLDIADECFSPPNYLNQTLKKIPRKRIEEHVKLATEGLRKLDKYPRVAEGYIRLAMYYLGLNDKETSRKYFRDFEKTNTPIHHYAFWLQNYYVLLHREFSSS